MSTQTFPNKPHNWDNSLTCDDCNKDVWSVMLYACEAIIMSCCGKYGVDIWDTQHNQWKCSKCGAVKSNDPNYVYNSKLTIGGVPVAPQIKPLTCLHIWKQYHGLKESFEYCEKCDEKKNAK